MRPSILLSAFLVLSLPASALAQTPTCERLWEQRNAIYKDSGYCFRTPKAIAAFGNRGCRYDDIRDLPLSDRDRQAIQEIAKFEARNRCTAGTTNGETFEPIRLRIELTATALRKLSDNGETLHVRATYYGNSRRADGDQFPADVILGEHEFDVDPEAANAVVIPAATFDRRLLDRVYDRTPQVNIRIITSRKVFKDNLVHCNMPQASVADLAKETQVVRCPLIGEPLPAR